MTRGAALARARAALTAAGVADPAGDAAALLAHVTGQDRAAVALAPDVGLADADRTRFEQMIDARSNRQPVSQIIGQRAFWRHTFCVTPDTLDPRPESEVLVACAIACAPGRVLDLGTGTGALLLSILADLPAATGVATDASRAALVVASQNAARLGLADRADFAHGDWLAPVDGRFDVIVCNPPYIAADEFDTLAPEVTRWEPRAALTPEGDGLDAYRALAPGLGRHLSPGGRAFLEFGLGQEAAVRAILSAAGLGPVILHDDLSGRPRAAEVSAR